MGTKPRTVEGTSQHPESEGPRLHQECCGDDPGRSQGSALQCGVPGPERSRPAQCHSPEVRLGLCHRPVCSLKVDAAAGDQTLR